MRSRDYFRDGEMRRIPYAQTSPIQVKCLHVRKMLKLLEMIYENVDDDADNNKNCDI